ncbi:uncharacterized protein MEPE_01173 [Melanopsichium pennsylvanicum]|uniref:Palmitoyltransferase n=2 Tax=Melanopsichium pennsylvanicum TaxID=63383 RepID=A0AAJ4XI56_9BASI|nr:conserved hypothetical protein [Melanopsichium pennsylvanicum 4]SNX82467.1 uncharacterized protein MEPE_01173 [Melanopsichium pennsylvanicum]
MPFSCDPNDPRSPPWLKSICRNLRWIPFFFILALILFAYLTVTISLTLRYHIARKGEWISALWELLFSTALAGGAVWGFIIAVFKDPGTPMGRMGVDTEGWGAEASAARAGSEYEMDRGEGYEEAQSLMHGHHAQDNDETHSSNRAPLLSMPIPGQPQYPARSGREQLDNLCRLRPSTEPSGPSVQLRSNIWVKSSGETRWCSKCSAPKPDRSHHCSTCNRCILRMDHHCPWLANRCVGLRNHKSFFLFISYTALFCVYSCQETARALLRYVEYENNGFETSPISWAVVLFLSFIFGASLVPFAGYHAYLILRNRTTIESMEGSGRIKLRVKRDENRPKVEDRLRGIVRRSLETHNRDHHLNRQNQGSENGTRTEDGGVWRSDEHLTREERRALKKASKLNVYDVGAASNWRQVMGNKWYFWLLPIGEPLHDGFSYPVQTQTMRKLEEVTASVRIRDEQQRAHSNFHHRDHVEEEHEEYSRDNHEEDDDDSVYDNSKPATRFGYGESSSVLGDARDTGLDRKPGKRFQGAHGEMEWGDAPKKSFVLFGVDNDEEEHN